MPIALEGRAGVAAPAGKVDEAAAIQNVWRQYKQVGGERLRRQLVVHYMEHHVRRLAERLHASLPQQVDVEDLVQQGYLGLAESIERFDIDRQVKFETFSARRISGAMRDWLREIDPLPRLARSRTKRLDAIAEDHRKRYGRPPTDQELLHTLEVSRDKLRDLMSARSMTTVRYQGTHPDIDAEDDSDGLAALADREQGTPLTKAEKEDLQTWVTRGFSRRDHLIITLYYYEHLTMREVGQALGISESRVSQRLDGIVKCLRSRLCYREAEEEFE